MCLQGKDGESRNTPCKKDEIGHIPIQRFVGNAAPCFLPMADVHAVREGRSPCSLHHGLQSDLFGTSSITLMTRTSVVVAISDVVCLSRSSLTDDGAEVMVSSACQGANGWLADALSS